MAEELRFVSLVNQTTETSSDTNNAITSFQNTTDENIFIRTIDFTGHIVDTSPVKNADIRALVANQLSKQVAYLTTNLDTNWKQNVFMQFAAPDDAANTSLSTGTIQTVANKSWRYAKGQLVLEPNETLYIHDSHTLSGAEVTEQNSTWLIGYHF